MQRRYAVCALAACLLRTALRLGAVLTFVTLFFFFLVWCVQFARMEKTLHEARSEATRVAKECRSLAEEVRRALALTLTGRSDPQLDPVVPFTHSFCFALPPCSFLFRLQVGHKADQSSIDRIVFDNSDEIEKIVRSYESKSAHDSKVQSAYLSDVRLQIEEMQSYQNQVDQKLQMALKFIDWFTDVKMKHM